MKKPSLIAFFILTYAITWGIAAFAVFFPNLFRLFFGELSDTHPLYYIAVAAPTLSATILTAVSEGRSGLAALYARLFRWRFGIQWYAIVLLGIPALGWLITLVTGSSPLKDVSNPVLLFSLLLNLLITGPLGEELGWRGFALSRLLKRFSPLAAGLILGAIWGVWHLPAFFISNMVQTRLSLPLFLISALLLSVLATWLFQRTAGSVLITVLFHYEVNFSASVLGAPLLPFTMAMLGVVVLVLVLDKKMGWFQKPNSTISVLVRDRVISDEIYTTKSFPPV